jgi:hypothetical protein
VRKILIGLFVFGLMLCWAGPARAFCGFYVARADASLYNRASRVIVARDGERTVLTMANDYRGEMRDFALVVPVPAVITEEQVRVGEARIIERLDAFSAPRLVEYFDENPCERRRYLDSVSESARPERASPAPAARGNNSLGVTVEQRFTVGEYDILVLSARESDGLETWLRQNVRQRLKFFVAKVNLREFSKTGFQSLRPLQIAYESRRFMLPIRLGMINSQGEQDLLVYLLSPKGRTDLTNYRTVKIPSNVDVPEFVREEFKDFYGSLFQKSYEREDKKVAFLEYAWDMANCDPCSAEPLSREELQRAGVSWGDSRPVFISRLHVRYTRDRFPEDLQFQETSDRESFQGRFVLRRPYRGEMNCSEAGSYRESVRKRQEEEARTLAGLTGWDLAKIRAKIDFVKGEPTPWWRRLWRSGRGS